MSMMPKMSKVLKMNYAAGSRKLKSELMLGFVNLKRLISISNVGTFDFEDNARFLNYSYPSAGYDHHKIEKRSG